ncbi:MAG: M48 family metallopeptidase, partial [Lacisediminimonas sp.]|nr:M48 family metallopeptidase [Lacisediminimonas sp.]
LSLLALLAGCASGPLLPTQMPRPVLSTAPESPALTAEQILLRNLVAYQDRLYRVSGPLLTSNPDLCKGNNARNLFGFTAKNKYSWSPELADSAQSLLGLDDRLQVLGVLPNSGAQRAGLKPGDKLVSVEGKPIPGGQNAERQAAALLAPMVSRKSSVSAVIQRNGASVPMTINLTRACAYGVVLGNADNINAYSDGQRVLITRGMMNFAQSDDDLALVLAKEMAHNSLLHPGKQKTGATSADIIDNLVRVRPDMSAMAGAAGLRPMPQELDAAADVLALYMVARAGYRYENAPRFWEKLARQVPANILNGYTAIHPATEYRLSVIGKIVPEIKAKQAGRQA